LFTAGSQTNGYTPSITGSLFNAGKFRANENLNLANQDLALIKYEQTVATAFNEVSNALVERSQDHEVSQRLEAQVKTLQDRHELAYLRYQGGVDSLLNALDADRDLFTAQVALARSQRNERLALVQLYKALGGGWAATPQDQSQDTPKDEAPKATAPP
jgi:multidrug efflux system outer membrane protein